MKLHTIDEVAQLLHKKKSTIYKDLTRRPESLPPRHFLPFNRKVLFKDVFEWMARGQKGKRRK